MVRVTETAEAILSALQRKMVDRELDTRTDLIEAAMFDSADFMELLVLLESEFDIAITAEDLDLEQFRTIERIAGFVDSKRGDPR